jgi:uncharacterized protein (DUF1501 family)
VAIISRRTLLASLVATATAARVSRVGLAAVPGDQRFVFVILRGAMDGLTVVPPYGDPDYRALRGELALPEPGAENGILPLDNFFGLHPSLAPIYPLWRAGELQIVHAAATPYRDRSHFDAQNVLENGGKSPSGVATGWLNRALAAMGGRVNGLAVGAAPPLTLVGSVPVATWMPISGGGIDDELLQSIDRLYAHDPAFHAALTAARYTTGLAGNSSGAPNGNAGKLPLTPSFEGLAKLLVDEKGPRVATVEVVGWDTHFAQASRMAGTLAALAEGLDALRTGLGPVWSKTVVVTATEFGRTARPNGTNGTDHGTATASLVLGGALAGARIHAQWPGLASEKLYENRDLAATSDVRGLFATVLHDHLGMPVRDIASQVFPGDPAVRPLGDVIKT